MRRVSVSTLLTRLKACSEARDRRKGQAIHQTVIESGSESNAFIANALINMYSKCGSVEDARRVFDGLKHPSVVSWTVLITGYADDGKAEAALGLFARMRSEGCAPDGRAFVAALRACSGCMDKGEMVQVLAARSGCHSDVYVQCTLMDMYASSGCMRNARRVFGNTEHPNVVAWTSLMCGYAENGEAERALDLFAAMRLEGCAPNSRTYVAALKASIALADNENARGEVLHLLASRSGCDLGICLQGTLLDMYAKSGAMKMARSVFDSMQYTDVVAWTSLILGYAENGEAVTALELFARMCCAPNARTFVAALKACSQLTCESMKRGMGLHLLASLSDCDSDKYVQCTLIDMYMKNRNTKEACTVFRTVRQPDAVSWNALILGYAANGEGQTALDLFQTMRREACGPDARTFTAVLKACSHLANEEVGSEYGHVKVASAAVSKQLHLLASMSGCDSNVFVQSTLVDAYAKCGTMREALMVFDLMKERNVVAWTALIMGYADSGEARGALALFSRMKVQGYTPNARTFVAALKACGMIGSLELGKAIHADICCEVDEILANCLVDFYAKCGSLDEAEHLFDLHPKKSMVTWNVLMAGYSRHGDTSSAFRIFERMCDAGVQPNELTFMSVLTACSHAGLVETGRNLFEAMPKHGIHAQPEHYTCMVDMLGRVNKLDDAMALVRDMPLEPDFVTWLTVLGACQRWRNSKLGTLAFESLMSLDSEKAAAYTLMAQTPGYGAGR